MCLLYRLTRHRLPLRLRISEVVLTLLLVYLVGTFVLAQSSQEYLNAKYATEIENLQREVKEIKSMLGVALAAIVTGVIVQLLNIRMQVTRVKREAEEG